MDIKTNKNRNIRKSRLSDQGKEDDLKGKSPGELMGMVWELTKDAWAFKGEPIDPEQRLQRHVVRVIRGRR
jgi:hypothetical protein